MSPDRAPKRFGRTPQQTLRGALLFVAVGMTVVYSLSRFVAQPWTPLGAAYRASGLPPHLPLVTGGCVVLLLTAWASVYASRSAETYRLDERGLAVRGWLGAYCLEWSNVMDVDVTDGGNLGVRVRSRDGVLATHTGTAKQLEWLRTQEPFGEWDYLFTRADLGTSPDKVCGWMRAYLEARQTETA